MRILFFITTLLFIIILSDNISKNCFLLTQNTAVYEYFLIGNEPVSYTHRLFAPL